MTTDERRVNLPQMADDWPEIDPADAARYVDKVVLVCVTFVDHNDELLEQKQWCGRVARASTAEGIVIVLDDGGDPCVLPPDLSYLKPAPPGRYRLRSTGRVVEDPDFTSTWTCKSPPPDECQGEQPEGR